MQINGYFSSAPNPLFYDTIKPYLQLTPIKLTALVNWSNELDTAPNHRLASVVSGGHPNPFKKTFSLNDSIF